MSKTQAKTRVFSGTRATGRLHLGNYLGAVKGYIELSNNPDYECIYMVMDLHTITTPYDHENLPEATRNVFLDYLAAGLNPEKSIITAQSLVSEHTYLSFLFSSAVSVARMRHLPTFKDKVRQHPRDVTMALLNYPVLMAADILIYKSSLVPVGIDQEPHIEIAREIARHMNERYDTDFSEPQRFSTPAPYVPSLLGEGKMSKSIDGSFINLTDDLERIKKRLAGVPTDLGKGQIATARGEPRNGKQYISSDKQSVGVASLLEFVELFQGKPKREEYEELYQSTGIRYGDLKSGLAEAIYKELKPIQEKRKYFESHPEIVDKIIQDGAEKARSIAAKTLEEVKQKMGLN